MGHCKTCRWWIAGCCDLVGTTFANNPDTLLDIEVEVADDHGLDVKLRTGPNFGCVHHKEKTPVADESEHDLGGEG